jgi:hypothetical protein
VKAVLAVRLVVGALLVLVGAVWIGQGTGWIGGSFMTGEAAWALIGAACVVAGGFVFAAGLRARRD